LFFYSILLLAIAYCFSFITLVRPGVLGIASDISVQDVIQLTNQEREKNGIGILSENSALDQAAIAKANDMFAQNYWAHISPTGKTPWEFIRSANYSYTAAGENLARDFDKSPQVVEAWMNSPSHKENLLSGKFTEIGVGVVSGTLEGKETTLVVQMFGHPSVAFVASTKPTEQKPVEQKPAEQKQVAEEPVAVSPTPVPTQKAEEKPLAQAPPAVVNPQVSNAQIVDVEKLVQKDKVFNNFAFQKTISLILISLLCFILLIDFVLAKKRGLIRETGLPIAHLGLLVILFIGIWYTNSGLIL
jgi:uncharacterized protein YkwD